MQNKTVAINEKSWLYKVSRSSCILRDIAGRVEWVGRGREGGRVNPPEPHSEHCCLAVTLLFSSLPVLCTNSFACKPLASLSTQSVGILFPLFCFVSHLHFEPLTPQTKGRAHSYVGYRDTLFLLNDEPIYARTVYFFRLLNWSFYLRNLYSACLKIYVFKVLLYSRDNRADFFFPWVHPILKQIVYHWHIVNLF